MNFDRNTIIGITLIVILFIVMTTINQREQSKYAEEQAKQKKEKKNTYPVSDSVVSSPTATTIQDTNTAKQYGSFAGAISGTEKEIVVENENAVYTFSTKGGILKQVELKDYVTHDKKPLIVFRHKPQDFNVSFVTNEGQRTIETADLFFQTNAQNAILGKTGSQKIAFTIDLGNGRSYQHVYEVPGSGHVVKFDINANNFDTYLPKNTSYFSLNWTQYLPSQERGLEDERMNTAIYFQDAEKNVDDIGEGKDKAEKLETPVRWLSFKQKFFNTSIITKGALFNPNAELATKTPEDSAKWVKTMTASLQIPFSGSASFNFPTQIYVGPNKFSELKKLGVDLQKVIPIGGSILGLINKFLVIPIFNFLHKFIPNYGIIILILSIIIKVITLPFTYKSQLSMVKMKVLKPELDELRAKYGKDQAVFGQKQMELFNQTGVSPFGGCLPMLLQWPFLIAMYRFFPSALELRQEPFLWAKDLSSYDDVITWGANVPLIGNHLSMFALLGVITSFAMTFYTMKNQPQTGGGGETAEMMQKQMKIMQYIFPVMILFFFNNSSSALSYYFFLFNVLSLLQQWLMTKYIDESAIRAQIEINKKTPKKKGAFQSRMEEMMKQQQELKKQQQQKKK